MCVKTQDVNSGFREYFAIFCKNNTKSVPEKKSARRLVFVNSRRRSSAARAAALPRRPTMLLLLLWLLFATVSSESSPGTISKPLNQSCPETGYFFEKESGLEPATCYLCFCTDDDAVCSLRPAANCDKQLYTNEKKILKRVRRNPGLADIFFRDATRQIFNREPTQEDCKPNSSKSIGCPPADWCKGCMVCDCDANGHWECHLMSFCDGDSRRKSKKSKKNDKKKTVNAKPVKKDHKKKVNKDDSKKSRKIVKKSVNNPMPQISVETKKSFKRMDQNSPVVIKRYISTKSPINSPELLKYKNEPSKLAQKLYKQYMSSIGKAPSKIRRRTITDKHNSGKTVKNKRIFKANPKQNKMKHNKPMNTNKNKHKNNPKVKKGQKRDGNKKQLKKKSSFKGKKYMTSKFNTKKRSKRNAMFSTTYPTNVTNFEGTAYKYHSARTTEVPVTAKDNVTTNLNNYAYTVDDLVTASNNNNGTRNYSQYETTERYLDIITIDGKNLTTKVVRTEKTVTKKIQVEHTTDRGLKLMNVYNDVLKKTQLMNEEYFQQSVTAESVYNLINKSKTLNEEMRRKVYALDKKKIALAKKKCNLKKLIKTLNSRIRFPKNSDIFKNKSSVDEKSTRVKIDGTLNDIQKLLEKMLHGDTKNKKTKERLKSKSFIAIKYLKKLFSKLFSRRKNRTAAEKVAVLDSICETFGPCRISEKKMKIVNLKVKQLISETLTALKSIKIIKGLLHLLNDKNETNVTKENDFKIHLKRLNAILKEEYSSKLSWTQTKQMNYIKANTQVFIKSIGNFAIILNDIISIIQSENKQFNLKQGSIIKNQRIQENNAIPKIKRLLFKYNLIQDTFLRKMYGALTDIEKTVTNGRAKTTSEPVKTETQNKIESENNMTYKIAIDKYVDNINENLQKLKKLAARMNSKTRRKRDVRDDDAIEYLLTLMEYLLKRNNPLDTPPVNDGIDLLIEAIRRAPDIRPIQKPKLQYVPFNTDVTDGPVNSAVSREESDSKSKNENSKEDSKAAHDKSTDESADNDINGEDRKMNKKDEVTTKSIKDFVDLSDVITEYPSKVYMASYIPYESTEKPDNETEIRKSYDTDPLVDDDNLKIVQKAESALEASNQLRSTTLPIFKEDKEDRSKMRQHTPREEYPGVTKEPKTKLDLINEAYEQEIKEEREQFTAKPVDFINYDKEDKKNKSTVNPVDFINENYVPQIKEQKNISTAKPRHRVKGETGTRNLKSLSADISSITKEIVDDKEKPTDTEKVSYRKQMDLLNSLDYGTDKSLIDDSDSKDKSPVDRFISDNDPFVTY